MKKIILAILFLLCTSVTSKAQQNPLYSQYLNNPFLFNPAYAGFTKNLTANVNYRQQWSGFEGGPKTINLSSHISLLNNKMGAGIMVVSDQLGADATNEVFGAYSYRIKLDKLKTLSFGLQAGVANYQIDNDKLNPQDPTDQFYSGMINEFRFNVGGGVILSSDNFFISLSVPRILKSKWQEVGLQSNLYAQHFYGMGSYLFFLSDRVKFKPSFLVRHIPGAPTSVDLNTTFIIRENYHVGILTRNFNTYGVLAQILINNFRFGYVFEIPTSNSVGPNFTSHEVMIGVRFKALKFHDLLMLNDF